MDRTIRQALNLPDDAPITVEDLTRLLDAEDTAPDVLRAVAAYAVAALRRAEDDLRQRRLDAVEQAINSLSYTELEAMQYIFGELPGNEGLLVASKIADRAGITRSVIVNALRKLESAGVITARSLGMKGTYIKVLNPDFIPAIKQAA